MKRMISVLLLIPLMLCFNGCRIESSLSISEVKSLIDTSYYKEIVFEEQKNKQIHNLAPFKQLDLEQNQNLENFPLPLLDRFFMLSKFKGNKQGENVYINGKKYKKGEVLTMSVLILTDDDEFSVWPCLVFIKHNEKNSTEIYNSIRINTDSLRVPHYKDVDEDAEFGEGYFAYSVAVQCDKNKETDCDLQPKELFSIEVSFSESGHYTVATVDSYKNSGKYTDSLSLVIE